MCAMDIGAFTYECIESTIVISYSSPRRVGIELIMYTTTQFMYVSTNKNSRFFVFSRNANAFVYSLEFNYSNFFWDDEFYYENSEKISTQSQSVYNSDFMCLLLCIYSGFS